MRILSGLLVLAALVLSGGGGGAADLGELAAKHRFTADQIGFVVIEAETGKVVAEHQSDLAVVPASVAKLPTAIAALTTLGPEHRFVTELALEGTTLVLVGGGDPFLTPEDLRPAFRRLKEAGRRVERFVYDASIWPEAQEIDPAQPEASTYNPGVGALAMDFNRVQVDWKESGRRAIVLAVSDQFRLEADAVRLVSGPSVVPPPFRFLAEGPDRWVMANLPPSGRAFLPIKRPALNAALVIRRLAEREGVMLPMPVEGVRPAGAVAFHLHNSHPLAEIVCSVLKHSNNMAAEMLGLATAVRVQGRKPADLAQSVAAVDAWFAQAIPGVDWGGFRRANHSGLSPDSRVTPRQIAALMRTGLILVPDIAEVLPTREIAEYEEAPAAGNGDAKPAAAAEARKTEPKTGARTAEAGKPEAKEAEPKKPPPLPLAILRYRAKTGTMAYARGLAGLLWTHTGKPLAFAVFVYDDAQRAAFDATLDRRLPEMPAAARTWIRRARGVEQELLREWAATL